MKKKLKLFALTIVFCLVVSFAACGGNMKPSVGLEYELNEDESSYTVVGIGECEDTNIFIPRKYKDLPVTIIGEKSFYNCNSIKSVVFPDSVVTIEDYAFENCNLLSSVKFEEGSRLKLIGLQAFAGCQALKTIVLPDNEISIKESPFDGTAYYSDAKNWDENGVLYLGNYLIGVNDTIPNDYAIKSSTKAIAEGAFWFNESITNIVIPNGVTAIERDTFSDCSSLKSVKFASNSKLASIGDSAFEGCKLLENISIPEGVASIGYTAFTDCRSLKAIVIPEKVTSIEEGTFSGCRSLTSILIPKKVTRIGRWAISGCSSLKKVFFGGTNAEWNSISIDNSYNGNDDLLHATRYYFTEDAPSEEQWAEWEYWWHYDPETNEPTPWVKENQ